MSGQSDWKQRVVDALFLAAESVAWYIIVRVGATALEQVDLLQLEHRVRLATNAAERADAGRAAEALLVIERALSVEHGPGLLVVLAMAFGGFYLMRVLVSARLDGVLGAAVLVAGSVLALNLLLHLAVVGDARVWDPAGLARAFSDAAPSVDSSNVEGFLSHPVLARTHRSTVSFTLMFTIVMWSRFVAAGRSRVTFERVLRSFTLGFFFTIVGLAFGAIEGTRGVPFFAVPQFILGVLGLAVANNARASAPAEGARRTGPWIVAVGGTVAMLVGVALLLGTLAFLNIAVLLNAVGEVAWAIISFILILVVTPIYWAISQLVHWLAPNGITIPMLPRMDFGPPGAQNAANEGVWAVPIWAQNGLKFLAVLAIVAFVYWLALLLMRRRRVPAGVVDEVRGRALGAIGIGALLRGIMPGARRSSDDDWVRRQPIYRLYARAARAAEERGFRYLRGETPIDFGERADRAMHAPPYPPIGLLFDRARYGRHYPEDGQVRSLEGALGAWEAATPPTEELRHRLAGARPLSETEEFLLSLVSRRQLIARNRRALRGGTPEPEGPQRGIDSAI